MQPEPSYPVPPKIRTAHPRLSAVKNQARDHSTRHRASAGCAAEGLGSVQAQHAHELAWSEAGLVLERLVQAGLSSCLCLLQKGPCGS